MPCAAKMTLGEWSGGDTAAIDVATLYLWGCKPFLGALGQYSGTIRAEIGRSQKGLLLTVCVGSLLLVLHPPRRVCPSRCIEVLYYKGLDVKARSGEPPSVLTLFDRVFVHENLTCEEQVPCYSSKKFAPVCSNCACDCAGVNNIGASIPSVNIVELRGKQPMLKRRHN